ncbi:putative uncharacterized protein DDB_G0282133 isoform X2 [Plodia interpunctella]|nr:putative uncharacterized protein DDB_G0282133 isoform X2 [Plodia interpunctella]
MGSPKKKLNSNSEAMEELTEPVIGKKRKLTMSTGSGSDEYNSPKKKECYDNNKKIKEKIIFENSNDTDYLDIKVKNEELSTSETSYSKSKKNKRKKHDDSEDFDDKFLNLQVKQEQSNQLESVVNDSMKKKKNKQEKLDKKNESEDIDEHSLPTVVKDEPELSDSTLVRKKKKKSKSSITSNFDSHIETESNNDDYFNIVVKKEENTFTKPKSKKKRHNSDYLTNTNQAQADMSLKSDIESTPKKKKNRKSESFNTESGSESAQKSKEKKNKQLADNESILVNSEKDVEQHTTSQTSHLVNNRFNDKQQTPIKSHNRKINFCSDTTLDDDRHVEKKTGRRTSSNSISVESIPAEKVNVPNSANKSSQLNTNTISRYTVRDDSSSDNEGSIEIKQAHVEREPNKNSQRKTISRGDSISDPSSSAEDNDNFTEPKSSTTSNSNDDSCNVNNSNVNEKKTFKPIATSPNKLSQNTPRTFSKNYDSSDESNSDHDKSAKYIKSPQVRKQSKGEISRRTVSSDSSSDDDEKVAVKSKSMSKSPKKINSISRDVSKSDDSSDDDTRNNKPVQSKKATNRRITDRIRFELDDSDATDRDKVDLSSSKLKHFQETNSNLSPIVNKPRNNSIITSDDEIWILKCPRDINVGTLKDVEFVLDKKCKFKINGETYHGTVANDIEKIAITSYAETGFVIKNLPLNGVVHVRKRIPKSHVQDDSMLMQSQNQFIPLPETKCRHPFFGADYKKAIKVPKRIAQYLKAEQNEVQSPEEEMRERKKNKKRMRESLKEEPQEEVVTEEVIPEKIKKAKKRKHDDSDEIPAKKSKKKKHESSEVWDSEKAIEENLFNY